MSPTYKCVVSLSGICQKRNEELHDLGIEEQQSGFFDDAQFDS